MSPRVKICCIQSAEEARLAIDAGASALGLVSAMPSGPGVIPESQITGIARSLPPPIATFLLTSENSPDRIVEQQRRCRTNTLQLCDHLPSSIYSILRDHLPGIHLVQVVHVTDAASADYAVEAAQHVDALLLDSGNLAAPVKELGGTGRTHDWSLSRRIRDTVPIPVFLAGGLTPDNVGDAIRTVDPYGLDLCGGVRSDNQLDPMKLKAFFNAIAHATYAKQVPSNSEPQARQLAHRFIETFCQGDVDGLAALLANDATITGPLIGTSDKQQYLQTLRNDPPEPAGYRLISMLAEGDEVVAFWDYEKPEATITISLRLIVGSGRIHRAWILFDSSQLQPAPILQRGQPLNY